MVNVALASPFSGEGEKVYMSIDIPTDNDGYVLLQCSLCHEYFKVTPTDYQDEGFLWLCCPNCGLIAENYLTEDVIELALDIAQNLVNGVIHANLKKLERQIGGDSVTFKVGKKPQLVHENPIYASIEALNIRSYRCCGRTAKIKPILQMTGSSCPFCGVKSFETE